VPLNASAIDAFRRQAERCSTDFGLRPAGDFYVFPARTGPDCPHRPDSFGDRFASARGSRTTTFLHLRHYAATSMLDAGEDYRTVADILGNSETTLRLHYDGRTNIDKHRAIAALEFP
jgi:integrase